MQPLKRPAELLSKLFNAWIIPKYPRGSVQFAQEYFKGKELIAVEVGVSYGDNARDMFRHLNIKKLYLIDPYEDYEEYADSRKVKIKKYQDVAYEGMKKLLAPFKSKTVHIKKYSTEAVKDIKEKCDFIYIDANHAYEYVLKDIKDYYPLLKKGGIIGGHDAKLTGVLTAAAQFVAAHDLQINVRKDDWWFIKR